MAQIVGQLNGHQGVGGVASFDTFLFVSTCGATKTMRQRQDNVICFSDLATATRFFAAFPVAAASNGKYRNLVSFVMAIPDICYKYHK